MKEPLDSYGARQAWYMLVVSEILGLAAGIDVAIVTLLVHPIETTFRINDTGFATITTISLGIGTTVAYYPAGLLADIFRRRDVIAVGSAIWALAAFIAARADSEAILFFARLLAGVGIGVTAPATLSMLTDAFPRARRAFAIGVYTAAAAIGTGVGLTICSALVEATQRNGMVRISGILLSPWQQCFVAVAAMGLVGLALVLTVREPPRGERVALTNSNLKSTLGIFGHYLQRHWLLWALLLFGTTISATSGWGINSWAPAFGARRYGAMGVSSIALLGAFTAGGSLLGSILGGLLAQRGINHGNPRVLPRMLVAISVIFLVFACSFPYMPSWLLAVVGIGGVNAAWTARNLLVVIGIQETASNEVRGQLIGLWGFISYIPQILGATLVASLASGVFAKAGGLGPALGVVGCVTSALGLLLFAFSGAPYERARRELQALVASSPSI